MADLSVGLAKSVVERTVNMAQAAIAEEAKLRLSAQRDLMFITDEFQIMQSFLRAANTERVENLVVLTWVRQIRELAYDVEDCIEFVIHLDKAASWWFRLIPSCIAPALQLDEAVAEIEQLKARVADVSTRNTRYSLIGDTGSKPDIAQQQPTSAAMLIGAWTKHQQGDLTQLLPKEHDGLQVISVIGSGGDLGVTSVIWKAYNDSKVCQDFTCRAWVKLTHPFSPHEFVQCLIRQFYANACQQEQERKIIVGMEAALKDSTSSGQGPLKKLVLPLNHDRYLVVLEDLSTMADWDAIRKLFPSSKIGSCIIISTQQPDVATLSVGHPCQSWKLNQFSVDHCVYAFYKEGSQHDKYMETNNSSAETSNPKEGQQRQEETDSHEKTSDVPIAKHGRGDEGVLMPNVKGKADGSVCEIVKTEGSQRNGDKYMETDNGSAETSNPVEVRKKQEETDGHIARQMKAAETWIKQHQIVGRDSEMHDLRQTIGTGFDSKVMSVWGIIGIGKTTLLKHLFCEMILHEEKPFDKHGWVDVSHPFNLRDFSQSLLLNFDSESLEVQEALVFKNSTAKCRDILKESSCLVVIDGLRSTTEWDLIETELLSGSSRNCIIVITSEVSIAKHCRGDKGLLMFNVKAMEYDSAYKIFENKLNASAYPLAHRLSDEEGAELKQLVSKCGGLPKVIVEIASTLGTKSVNQMESAHSLSNNFMHHLENNREFEILQSLFGWISNYFRSCPDSVKPCIFYLSMFPGGRILRRRRLIRRWIAEGYSRDNHEKSAEESGETQFSDLLDLSIILRPPQNISITVQSDTRMTSCQVSGFIREYIVSNQMEENLVFELGGCSTITTQRTGRHLVIYDSWRRDRILFDSMDFSRLRSLTVFGKWESFFICESMKLLRVLDLENAASQLNDDDLKKMVNVLLRLKFLSLRGHHEIHHVPGSLHKLRQLQTLDVRGTSITTLPGKISKCQKMQYIRAGTVHHVAAPDFSRRVPKLCRCHRHVVGVEVPPGIGKLTALHTLGVVNVDASGSGSTVKQLKKLTQLRKLGVCGLKRKKSMDFFSAIEDHVQLESLSVRFDRDSLVCRCFKNDNQGYFDKEVSLPYKNLKSLKLHGLHKLLPKWKSGQLTKLAKVDIEMSSLEQEGMKLLGQLPRLCILRVKLLVGGNLEFNVEYNFEQIDSFKEVKVLQIACSGILEVSFGSQTMKKLELLKIDCCVGLYTFSDLNYLDRLRKVLVGNGPSATALVRQLGDQLQIHPNKYKAVVEMEETQRSS